MSLKVATFTNLITQPLNIHNFIVTIPGVEEALLVSSTTFPTEKLRVITMWFQGEPIRYPGLPENDGVWKIKVPENEEGRMRKVFDKLKSDIYNQKSGHIKPPKTWNDVVVTARDLQDNDVFQVKLHGVWLKGRNPIDLANNDPSKTWEWEYEFCYQWIEDIITD